MRITLIPPTADAHDVELTVVRADDATWADLAEALFGRAVTHGLAHLVVDGEPRRLDRPFDARLVQPGSIVSLRDAARRTSAQRRAQPHGRPVAELRVVGGLEAGTRAAAAEGPLVIGRDPDCDLVLGSPTVSRRHAVLQIHHDGRATVTDTHATNGVRLGDAFVTAAMPSPHDALVLGATCLQLAAPSSGAPSDDPITVPRARAHNRPPRLLVTEEALPLRVPDQLRAGGARTPFSWAMALTPLLVGALMARLVNPLFAVFALLSPMVMIASWFEQRRRGARERRRSGRDQQRRLDRFAADVEAAARAHTAHLRATVPDLVTISAVVTDRDPRLWERRRPHDDFGVLRLGRATRAWTPALDVAPERASPEVQQIISRRGVVRDAPVTARIGPGLVVGLVGPGEATTAVARSLVLQTAVLHGPADVWIAVAAAPDGASRWRFISWLPHHRAAPAAAQARCCTTEGDLRALVDELPVAAARAGAAAGPFGVVVVDSSPGDDSAEGTSADGAVLDAQLALVQQLAQAGHSAVVVARAPASLPAACTTVVECLDAHGSARVLVPAAGSQLDGVLLDGITEAHASAMARRLTGMDDPAADRGAASLPAMVHLRALLDLDAEVAGGGVADPLSPTRPADATETVLRRWHRHRDGRSLRAVVGVDADGPHVIDLVEDGPHALIGGTTGSGKSELLRAWVMALAASHAPDDLSFVLIDYKGGSAFDACAELPHVVGIVTDLDQRLGARALRSLDAELRAREHRLRAAGVSDFVALRAAGAETEGRLPRLVVIIDEFATLAADVPGFLDALVGVAQRGRSLGVHLVLATQRPHGAINDNIRTNTNLRIALRMLDATDSIDVIGTRDASAIDRRVPGRVVSITGSEPPVVWQAAHLPVVAGGAGLVEAPVERRHAPGVEAAPGPFRVVALDAFGLPRGGGTARAGSAPDATVSMSLDRLVADVQRAFHRSGLPVPPRPWLPPLERVIPIASLHDASLRDASRHDASLHGLAPATPGGSRPGDADSAEGRIVLAPVPLGLTDEPDEQRQRVWRWEPTAGPLAVYGMPGTGKTNAALAVVDGLARAHPAGECHLYVIGSPTPALTALVDEPQVGAVIAVDERDRVRRLLRWLDERRSADAAPGGRGLPAVVIIVDGAAALLHALDDLEGRRLLASFLRLASEGPRVGIHLVITGDRPQSIPTAIAAATRAKVVLQLPDPYDYSLLGLRAAPPTAGPGRGVLADGTEIQLGLVETPQACRPPTNGQASPPAPVRIGRLPDRVAPQALPPAAIADGAWRLPLGIDATRLEPCGVELRAGDHVLLAGPPGSGRTTALLQLGCAFEYAALGRVHVLSPRPNALSAAFPHHATTPTELFVHLARAAADDAHHRRPHLVLVDDGDLLSDARLHHLVTTAHPWLRIIVAARADRLRCDHSHWTRPLRSGRYGVALDASVAGDGDLWNVRVTSDAIDTAVRGRAALICDGRAETVQVACP